MAIGALLVTFVVMYFIIKLLWSTCQGLIMVLFALLGYGFIAGGLAVLFASPVAGIVILLIGGAILSIYQSYDNKRKEQMRIEEWQRRQNEPWNYMDR